jgi:hypothetical protein
MRFVRPKPSAWHRVFHGFGSGTCMLCVLLPVLAILVIAGDPAMARSKKVPRRETWKPPLSHQSPLLHFLRGTLSIDHAGSWRVGDVILTFAPSCRFTEEGRYPRDTTLEEGREVLLVGRRFGSTMLVYNGIVISSMPSLTSHDHLVNFQVSGSDPTVGQAEGPN